MDLSCLKELMSRAPDMVITVLGDFCLDKYLYIDADRDEPSLETGLTAYQVVGKGIYPGGAGTVANNLRALTAQVGCVGVIGEDGEGCELTNALRKIGADTAYMVADSERCTSTYTKPMRGRPGAYTELSRLDFKNYAPMSKATEDKVIANMRACAAKLDALIVVDQFVEPDCGVVNSNVRKAISELARERPGLVIFADSRAFIHLFSGVVVKCNNYEVVRSVVPDFDGEPDEQTVLDCGKKLCEKNGRPVFVTLGERGIRAFDGEGAHRARGLDVPGPIDICGAGDAATSGIALALALGANCADAAVMGNLVASITIQQIGVTGTATPAQVIERYKDHFC